MAYVSSVASDVTTYEPVTTSGEVTFSGLGNGTDFTEIIEAQVAAQSYKLDEYEERLEEQEYVMEKLEALEDSFDELLDLLDELDEMDEFMAVDVSGGDDSINATATGDAGEGSHTVVVNQLAQADTWISSGYAFDSADDVVATADTTLTFTYGGNEVTIDVLAGTTVEELVDQINADSQANDYVTASLIDTGDGIYFSLVGEDTGADNAIVFTDTGTLTGITTANMTNTQAACDAQIKVDGFPAGEDEWISRSTNDIDDVIEGVSLELTDVTDEDGVRITTSYDEEAMAETITELVTQINSMIYDMQALTGRVTTYVTNDDGEQEEAPVIESYALDIMYAEFKNILSSIGTGFQRYDADTETGDPYTSLAQIGIETDAETDSDTYGQLLIDEDALEEALEEDPEAVAMLFAAENEVEVDGSSVSYISQIDGVTEAGTYDVEYTVEGGVVTSATIGGVAAEIDGNTILATEDSDAYGLYLEINDLNDGTHSSTVYIKEGKVSELSEAISEWTNGIDGTLTILKNSLESSMESLEDDIYYEQARLDAYETRLIEKYASLEATLSEYTNIESTLESLIAQLD
jgi:flagellar hook-associated protein 2